MPLFLFIFHILLHTYNHPITFIQFIRRVLSSSPHRLSAQWDRTPYGAEPRIELGPAFQQADALPLSHAAPAFWPVCHSLLFFYLSSSWRPHMVPCSSRSPVTCGFVPNPRTMEFQGLHSYVVYLGWPILIGPSYMSPNAGGGGGVAGSQPMNTAVYTGAQINFKDLTPYFTYVEFSCFSPRTPRIQPRLGLKWSGWRLKKIKSSFTFNT